MVAKTTSLTNKQNGCASYLYLQTWKECLITDNLLQKCWLSLTLNVWPHLQCEHFAVLNHIKGSKYSKLLEDSIKVAVAEYHYILKGKDRVWVPCLSYEQDGVNEYGRHSQAAAWAAKGGLSVCLGPHFSLSSSWVKVDPSRESSVPSEDNVRAWENEYDVILS